MYFKHPIPVIAGERLRRLAAALTVLSILSSAAGTPLQAQALQEPFRSARTPNSSFLKIFVLSGQNAVNRLPLGLAAENVVEVRDLSDLPVAGVEVVFTAPATGPGGTFNGEKQYRARTDSQGQAVAADFRPSGTGRFIIRVDALLGDRSGTTEIHQTNSSEAIASTFEQPKRGTKRWVVLSLISAGAAAGILLGTRRSTPPPVPVSVTLNPGAVSLGGPR